ncbi:hypothetical protein VTO73DRAFT_3672 [Trametes versicolor]
MSSQTVAQSASSVRALSNTTHTLNRLILENDPKVGRIDEFAHTSFRAQWIGNRENYLHIIQTSEAAAIKLSATIKYYLSLQGDINDPDVTDDLIEELGALNIKLRGIDFNRAADFAALKSSFQQLGREIPSAVQERDAVVRGELEAAQAEVAALEKQLQELSAKIKKEHEAEAEEATSGATTTIGGLFTGGKDKKPKSGETVPLTEEDDKAAKEKKAAELAKAKSGAAAAVSKLIGGGKDTNKAQRYAIQEKLDIAQAKLIKANSAAREREAADVDNVVLANQEIQKTLDTQVELFQTFPNLTQQLGAEVNNYLVAFENIKRDPSVDNQRALANLSRKVALASGPWKEVAVLLADGYARSAKGAF